MGIQVITSPYPNPYASFVSTGDEGTPRELLRRFKRNVRLPMPGEFVTGDPFSPMRRFGKTPAPPRFAPVDPATGGTVSTPRRSWDLSPPSNSMAVNAYRTAGTDPSSTWIVNDLR